MIELRKNMKEMMGKYKGWEQGADDRCEDKSQHYEKEINKLQVKLK